MLKNLTLRYDAREDRLLMHLLLLDSAGQEAVYALHVTRRLCEVWRADLQAMVDLSADAPEQLRPAARAAVSKAHHEAQAGQARVRTERVNDASTPVDHAPVLVTRIACGRSRADGRWVLQFERGDLPALGLKLNTKTMHALVDALSRRVMTARWNLPMLATEAQPAPSDQSQAGQFH